MCFLLNYSGKVNIQVGILGCKKTDSVVYQGAAQFLRWLLVTTKQSVSKIELDIPVILVFIPKNVSIASISLVNINHSSCSECLESFYKQLSTSTIATNNRLDVRLVLKFVHIVLNFVSFYIISWNPLICRPRADLYDAVTSNSDTLSLNILLRSGRTNEFSM